MDVRWVFLLLSLQALACVSRPPACGNGVVDVGEVCDEGVETSTCNVDCTLAICGDLYVNTVAGELCDDGGETATCDADCTWSECGDNLVNTSAGEACDATNGAETSDCNLDCTFSVCGDGFHNPTAGEACDDGGESRSCDPDCTRPECGDGYPNATSGEECDTKGETIDCDADCTFASCGDGQVNPTRGEQCDRGELNGDDCSVHCRFTVSSLANAHAKLVGESSSDEAGYSVSGAGDVNGDGFADLLLGARESNAGGSNSGAAYVVYGPVVGTLDLKKADAKLAGVSAGDAAGYSVSGAGDVNRDGFADVIVGARYHDGTGAAYLVYGPVVGTSSLGAADAQFLGELADDQAGYSVSGAGDVNRDGFDDLIVGARNHDRGGENAGVAYLIYGPVSGNLALADADADLIGEAAEDSAGSVSGAGDVDGDGHDDLLVGAWGNDEGESNAGAAYLAYGPVSGIVDLAQADAKLVGEQRGDFAGLHLAGAGDVNQDGFDDVLVGAWTAGLGGKAYLQLGPISGTLDLADADASFLGEEAFQAAGRSVDSAGDVNGDGFDDIVVGDMSHDGAGDSAGAMYLILGPVTGVLSLEYADREITGEAANDIAGLSVSGAGDVDGDGLDDVVVGARGNDQGANNAGAAYLLLGSTL